MIINNYKIVEEENKNKYKNGVIWGYINYNTGEIKLYSPLLSKKIEKNLRMGKKFINIEFLNSTIYFCRINHNEFNYSSNPTYLEDSKIVVKNDPGVVNQAGLSPITYITTVGLYSTNNELMAVAKLSEPLKKTPDNEFTLRVRLDY